MPAGGAQTTREGGIPLGCTSPQAVVLPHRGPSVAGEVEPRWGGGRGGGCGWLGLQGCCWQRLPARCLRGLGAGSEVVTSVHLRRAGVGGHPRVPEEPLGLREPEALSRRPGPVRGSSAVQVILQHQQHQGLEGVRLLTCVAAGWLEAEPEPLNQKPGRVPDLQRQQCQVPGAGLLSKAQTAPSFPPRRRATCPGSSRAHGCCPRRWPQGDAPASSRAPAWRAAPPRPSHSPAPPRPCSTVTPAR